LKQREKRGREGGGRKEKAVGVVGTEPPPTNKKIKKIKNADFSSKNTTQCKRFFDKRRRNARGWVNRRFRVSVKRGCGLRMFVREMRSVRSGEEREREKVERENEIWKESNWST